MRGNQKGFTLIELLIAVGIASGLSYGIYFLFSLISSSWVKAQAKHDIHIIRSKIELSIMKKEFCQRGQKMKLPFKEGTNYGQLKMEKANLYWFPGGRRMLDINYKIRGGKDKAPKRLTLNVPPHC